MIESFQPIFFIHFIRWSKASFQSSSIFWYGCTFFDHLDSGFFRKWTFAVNCDMTWKTYENLEQKLYQGATLERSESPLNLAVLILQCDGLWSSWSACWSFGNHRWCGWRKSRAHPKITNVKNRDFHFLYVWSTTKVNSFTTTGKRQTVVCFVARNPDAWARSSLE